MWLNRVSVADITMTELLLTGLKLAVALMILGIGLSATTADLGLLWRRPWLLLRSLVAMYVLVPAAAVVLVKLLPIAIPAKVALLVLAVSAGAPLLPRRLATFGSRGYVFSLVVTSSLASIVLVPLSIGVLTKNFAVHIEVEPLAAAAVIGKSFLAPLALGMVLRALLPALGERLTHGVTAVAGLLLVASALSLLLLNYALLIDARWSGFGALVLLMVIALAIGHVLGGPDPDDRTALAVACATRHLGIAVLVATSFPGPRVVVLISAYIVISVAVSVPYLAWRKRRPPAIV
jgi:predicted Na+-dependent transporter